MSSNKHHPREQSSKKPVPRFQHIAGVASTRCERLDPRFSDKCGGAFDEIAFRRDYAFIDELKHNELGMLKKACREAKREGRLNEVARLRTNILRLEHQKRAAEEARLMQETRAELRQTNIERMYQGMKPSYLNNRESYS